LIKHVQNVAHALSLLLTSFRQYGF